MFIKVLFVSESFMVCMQYLG